MTTQTSISSILSLEPEHWTFALWFAQQLRKPGGCTLTAEGSGPVVIEGEFADYLASIFEALGNGQVAVFHDAGKTPQFVLRNRKPRRAKACKATHALAAE